jgi:hypothetical protein
MRAKETYRADEMKVYVLSAGSCTEKHGSVFYLETEHFVIKKVGKARLCRLLQ